MKRNFINIIGGLVLMVLFTGQALAKEVTLRGRLGRTVEPGGWVLVASDQKYLILNSQKFQQENWFAEAVEVETVGELRPDVITTHMEGTPFEARTMAPLTQAAANQSQAKAATRVIVSGDSIVQEQPDTAVLIISVVSQAKRAIEAQQDNANRTEAVMAALKAVAGSAAEIKTSGYSLQPMRVYREGQPPTITGFEARNSVTVTMSDLTKVGTVIDAASQGGANDIAGLSFTLRRDRPARDEALAQATREAVSKARVIATALGGRLVRIVEVQEEGTNRPRPVYEVDQMAMRVGVASSTPIAVGSLDITSRVQMVVEIDAVP
jgi:uncharacterized protein